jgi:hypothetical protein
MAFEHFHFPEVFFRQTKKAYNSFMDREILDIARKAGISCNDAVALAAVVIGAAVSIAVAAELALVFATRRFKQIRKDS